MQDHTQNWAAHEGIQWKLIFLRSGQIQEIRIQGIYTLYQDEISVRKFENSWGVKQEGN